MITKKKTVTIWGSCVSRDIVRLHEDRFDLNYYLARQSWVSAVSAAAPSPEKATLQSHFQWKSLVGDITSNAKHIITEFAVDSDLLLIDLATDRRGVYPITGGGTASNTAELIESGLAKALRTDTLTLFGSDQHFILFESAAKEIAEFLRSLGIFERTLVIRSPFTDESVQGVDVPWTHGRSAQDWNDSFERYFGLLEKLGFALTAHLPEKYRYSTTDHAWNVGQDHYIDEAYAWWADQIEEFVESRYKNEPS